MENERQVLPPFSGYRTGTQWSVLFLLGVVGSPLWAAAPPPPPAMNAPHSTIPVLAVYVQKAGVADVRHRSDRWYQLTLRNLDDHVEYLANFEGPSLGFIPLETFVESWGHGFPNFILKKLHAEFFYPNENKALVDRSLMIHTMSRPEYSLATHTLRYEIELDARQAIADGSYANVVLTLDGIPLNNR